MSHHDSIITRRRALQCLGFGSAGTLFTLTGGVLCPIDLAFAGSGDPAQTPAGTPLFVQISDTHIGFNKEANPDVNATLTRTIDLVNALPRQPSLIIHTGDITHLSKPAEFDTAQQLLNGLRVTELHTTPGEHDTTDPSVSEYFSRFGRASDNRGYYSFDHAGVHFLALINVLQFKAGGLGTLGQEQIDWVRQDLKARASSTPIVLFTHMPMWTIYEPWGWGTGDAEQVISQLRRFGSVTILNGHIHQIVSKVEGNITYHTARSTAYPQPPPGEGSGPGPLKVPGDQLAQMLGITSVAQVRHTALALTDSTLAGEPAQTVVVRDFMFSPVNLRIRAGTQVTWTNEDEEPHTVSSNEATFRSFALDTNDTFSYRFDKPGTYRYTCTIHPRMTGTIVVE